MADKNINYNGITANEIDDILDEIDDEKGDKKDVINWKKVQNCIMNNDLSYIKSLISANRVNIDEQEAETGKTLLIYCTICGNFDMVNTLCVFGAEISIKDKFNYKALDYAEKYGYYRIAELLYFASLANSVSGELREKAELMFDKKQQTLFLLKHIDSNGKLNVIEYMIEAIQLLSPFSDDVMLLSWNMTLRQNDNDWNKINESKLWTEMMKTFESILKNTDNKKGWQWLKKYFVSSNIWLLTHPKDNNLTLFNELLTRTQIENKRQGQLLLSNKVESIKKTNEINWSNLVKYNVTSDLIKYENVRQDAQIFPNGIKSQYSEMELRKYKSTATFNAMQHVNLNFYLSKLLFYANIIDDDFQFAIQSMTNDILTKHKKIFSNSKDIEKRVIYKKGPVKQATRSRAKVEVEYAPDINVSFPSSAKLLDLNRCAIQFDDINELLIFLKQLLLMINDEENNKTCIKQIVRCKNGWSAFSLTDPNYCDIKLNVLISCNGVDLIGEIQFLLNIMSKYKTKAHKLYSIVRTQEFIDNFLNLQNKLNSFKNITGRNNLYLLNSVLCNLCKTNDVFFYNEIKKINSKQTFDKALELESEIDGLTPIHQLTIAHYDNNVNNNDLYKLINNDYGHLFKDAESNKSLLMTSVINGNIGYLVALKKQIDENLFIQMLFEKDNDKKTPLIFAEQYAQSQCKNFILNNLNFYAKKNENNKKLVEEYSNHRDKDNKTAKDWGQEMMENYIYLSSHNAFQLQAFNCKGKYLGTIMSCYDGENDDDEQQVINDDFDADDTDQWVTGFEVDKYGNLYVASYLTFLAKYLPSRGNETFYRKQCPIFRENIDRLKKKWKLHDANPEGVTTINDYKYDCVFVSVMHPINGVLQLSLNGELIRVLCSDYKIPNGWSLKILPYHFKDKILMLNNNKTYFMIEDENRLLIVDVDSDSVKNTLYCTSMRVTKDNNDEGDDGKDDESDYDDDEVQIGDFCFYENGYGESILCINLMSGIIEFRDVTDGKFNVIKRININKALKINSIDKTIRSSYGFTVGPDGLFYLADTRNNRILRFKFTNDIHSNDKQSCDYKKDIQIEVFAKDVMDPNYTTWFNSKIFT